MSDDIPQLIEVVCLKCGLPKPITDFKKWAIREGRQQYCKHCRRLMTYERHNIKTTDYRKKYYQQEHVKERQKEHGKKFWERLKNDENRHAEFRKRCNSNRQKFLEYHPCKKVAKSLKNRDKKSVVTPFDVWKIARRQKRLCALSGRKLTASNISPDHIVCLTNGGKSEPNNIRLVVKEVNVARQTMNDIDFFNMCQDIVRFNMPNRA